MLNTELLVKLSPLLIATLHGYGAAWLAVRMLFRPRRPMYFISFGAGIGLLVGVVQTLINFL